MLISCPYCQKEYDVEESRGGQTIQCAACCGEFITPYGEEPDKITPSFVPKISLDSKKSAQKLTQPTHKHCPMCGEKILYVAKKCRYCQSMLDGSGSVKQFNRNIYILLGLFAGGMGIHSFYAGREKEGNRHLTLFFLSFITFGITGLISSFYALLEIIEDPTKPQPNKKNHVKKGHWIDVLLVVVAIIFVLFFLFVLMK